MRVYPPPPPRSAARLTEAMTEQLQTASNGEDAETLMDQFVLSGCLAMYREDDASPKKLSKLSGNNTTVAFIATNPVSANGKSGDAVSMWSVHNGAIQVGVLKRAGKSSKLFGGKPSYFVVNDEHKVLY